MSNSAIATISQFPWEETPLFNAAMKLHVWAEEAQLRPGAKPYLPKTRRCSWRALQAVVSATTTHDRYSAGYYRSVCRYVALCALSIKLAGQAGALTEAEVAQGRELAHSVLLEIPAAPFASIEQRTSVSRRELPGVEDEQPSDVARDLASQSGSLGSSVHVDSGVATREAPVRKLRGVPSGPRSHHERGGKSGNIGRQRSSRREQ